MKKWTGILVASLVVFGLAGTVLAQATDNSDVNVVVGDIDKIDVTDGNDIDLDNVDTTPGTDLIGPDSDASAVLNYTHNSGTDKKITAEVETPPAGNDIDLKVEVLAGGTGPQDIVLGGLTQGAQTVYTNIAAGVVSGKNVEYTAQCRASLTPAGTYVFTVLYTTSDVS